MSPSRRMTVLTGETGAGKTALLAACKLLMGARADKGVVREGADAAEVQGRLFSRFANAEESGFFEKGADGEDAAAVRELEAVVKRRLTADGRSRASVNGEMASVSQLSCLVSPGGPVRSARTPGPHEAGEPRLHPRRLGG